ncbi:DUF1835 domain-containing protein [Roseibium sp.]|uniref:DUF1835 domain-containing protein n=1 Tax=Roseibium sp. TaxID=1936156 RepID=UPI003A9698E3
MTDNLRDAQDLPLLSASDLSLHLDRQKKRAKDLRDGARSREPDALARLKAHHPKFQKLDPAELKLSDAQWVIAREAGLPSWPALKRHVEQIDSARRQIEEAASAPDGDLPTLHIRCGNDIEAGLKRAGFDGDFLMFADPICQGPVSEGTSSLEERARFIAGEYPGQDEGDNLKGLLDAQNRLEAAGKYGRITLWFEHDPYDQLLLAKVLMQLKKTGADRRKVELVSLNRFPGISKFIGIGQLSPAALRHMFDQRVPVPDAAYVEGQEVWHALAAASPMPLFEFGKNRSQTFPYMVGAITRYLKELPDSHTGLSFTETCALKILHDGPLPWGKIFARFMQDIDPLPYHGDLMFLGTLLRLRDAKEPAISSADSDFSPGNWGKTTFSLTNTGQALLSGEKDWKNCGPRVRQHGGLTCFADADWRWDKDAAQPVSRRP